MIIRRQASDSPAKGIRALAYDKAREAAKEKRLTQYIHLTCGHVTTWEVDEAYSRWRPAKNKFFCETCGKWVTCLHKKKKNVLPAEPLF